MGLLGLDCPEILYHQHIPVMSPRATAKAGARLPEQPHVPCPQCRLSLSPASTAHCDPEAKEPCLSLSQATLPNCRLAPPPLPRGHPVSVSALPTSRSPCTTATQALPNLRWRAQLSRPSTWPRCRRQLQVQGSPGPSSLKSSGCNFGCPHGHLQLDNLLE